MTNFFFFYWIIGSSFPWLKYTQVCTNGSLQFRSMNISIDSNYSHAAFEIRVVVAANYSFSAESGSHAYGYVYNDTFHANNPLLNLPRRNMRCRILWDPINGYRIRWGGCRIPTERNPTMVRRIRSVFHGDCRIPMKSDADPIGSDRICRSDWFSWVIMGVHKCLCTRNHNRKKQENHMVWDIVVTGRVFSWLVPVPILTIRPGRTARSTGMKYLPVF